MAENEATKFQGATRVTQILGKVSVSVGRVEGLPAENATRWIVDVDQDDPALELALKHKYPIKGSVIRSYAIAPRDPRFWGACVHIQEGSGETLVIHCSQPCSYRLAVDTIHSASR